MLDYSKWWRGDDCYSSPVPHVPNPRCADVLHRDGDAVPRPQLWQVNLRFLLKSSKKKNTAKTIFSATH
jgi:hypothetical protein